MRPDIITELKLAAANSESWRTKTALNSAAEVIEGLQAENAELRRQLNARELRVAEAETWRAV